MDDDVIALFHELAGRLPAEREAYYAERQVPAAVREEVESLLRFDGAAGPSISGYVASEAERVLLRKRGGEKPAETQAAPSLSQTQAAHAMPSRIGAYRILRLVGEGGMGAVYEAEQEKPHRTVALKVVKPVRASAELVRRFDMEAQALGRLQHPGIARIYEAGTADTGSGPQPYFAMEYILGKPLGEYAESHRLNTRHRLELMSRISEAVHHAHQRGIIHRDLKPGNILVDETGQPKILDFGVARVTDSDAQATRQTDMGQLVGTLAYMSPEQVSGDPLELDTRSDVYALGVILYELLAGRLPYKTGGQLHEVVRVIQDEEPASLGAVDRMYRGDVETIAAKALEKDKGRRYASAAGLAGDIRRYLRDEPIIARPPSAAYQLRKFTKRNKALVAGVAAVFVVLVAGVIVSVSLTARANREAATAKAVSEFLQNDLLAQASAYSQANPQTKPDPDLKVRTALDRAAAKIAGKFNKQPLVEASIRFTIGETYWDLGLFSEAQTQMERAADLRRSVLGERHPDTLRTMDRLAVTYYNQGKYGPAELIAVKVLEARRRLFGEDHPDTLTSMHVLADIYRFQRKDALAESLLVRALEGQRRVKGQEHPDTLDSMQSLAAVYRYRGKAAQAEPLLRRCLEIRGRVQGEEHPDTLSSAYDFALFNSDLGRYKEAETITARVLEVQHRTLGAEHPFTLASMRELAVIYRREGKYEQSESLLAKALADASRVMGADSAFAYSITAALGAVYLEEGKYAQAEVVLTPTLAGRRRLFGEENPQTLLALSLMVELHRGRREYAAAEALLGKLLDARRRVQGAEHPHTLAIKNEFGTLYLALSKNAQAEAMFIEALSGRRRVLSNEHPDTLASLRGLAESCLRQGKYDQAAKAAREALQAYEKVWPENWRRYHTQSLLGAILTGERRFDAAEPLLLSGYQGLVPRRITIPAADRSVVEQAGHRIVQCYRRWGKAENAAEWQAKLLAHRAVASKR
jgi:serine/threonine protein kinase